MPSIRHELIVDLLRTTIAQVLQILNLGDNHPVRWWDGNPVLGSPGGSERRADLLLLNHQRRPTLGVVVEVQLRWDERKRFRFPSYHAAARDRHLCQIVALMVTCSASAARRISEPIEMGGGLTWFARAFGPREAWTWVRGEDVTRLSSDLLLLLIGVAGRRDDGRLAAALFGAATAVDSALDARYVECAVRALSTTGARVFQELVMNAKQEMDPRDFTNPLARWLYEAGLEQGEEKGLEKGLEQGEEKGLEKGLGIGRDALLQLAAVVCSPAEMEQLQRIDDLRVMQSTLADTLRDARSGR